MSHFSNNQNVNDIIYYYHKNMMAYHNNIGHLIQLLDTPPNPTHTRRTTSLPRTTTRSAPPSRRNADDLVRNFFTFIPLSTRTSSSSSQELTPTQIEVATETIPFTEEMHEIRCPISFEDFAVDENITRIKHCGHYFKTHGLMDWFRRSSQCPVCRFDLREVAATDATDASPEEQPTPTLPRPRASSDYRNEISHFLESIIQNIDHELATSFDFSNNQFVAEYSIDLGEQ